MHVLISGAGIAGQTAAWYLAKAGIQVTIVEKAKTMLLHGQNVDLTGAAIEVVRKMGLLEQVRKHNTTEKGTQFMDDSGKAFAPFPVNKGSSPSFTNEYEILRADLAKILYNANQNFPNITYHFGTTIDTVLTNDDTSVTVSLSNGETQEYDILVAADGQWSKLRRQNFPAETTQVVDLNLIVVYWTVPRAPEDNDWWNVYMALKSRAITLRPDPYGTIRAMFSLMPRSDAQRSEWHAAARADKKTQHDLLRREFGDAGWAAPRLLQAMDNVEAGDFYFHVIQQIKMSSWSQGRIICLGDTAYAPSPLTGMGTSLALDGGYVLAGEISKLAEKQHPSAAFESYEKVFRPFVEETQKIPPLVPGIAHPQGKFGRWLVHTLVRVLSSIVSYSWVSKWATDKDKEMDFLLPEYEKFDLGKVESATAA